MGAPSTPEWFFQSRALRQMSAEAARKRLRRVWLADLLLASWQIASRNISAFSRFAVAIFGPVAFMGAPLALVESWWASLLTYALLTAGFFVVSVALARDLSGRSTIDGAASIDLDQLLTSLRSQARLLALAALAVGIAVGAALLLRVLPALVMLAYVGVVGPVLAHESGSVPAAFRRSVTFVSKNLVGMLAVGAIVGLLGAAAFSFASFLLAPLPSVVTAFLALLVTGTLVAPFVAVLLTLVYYARREGLSVSLRPPLAAHGVGRRITIQTPSAENAWRLEVQPVPARSGADTQRDDGRPRLPTERPVGDRDARSVSSSARDGVRTRYSLKV